MNNTIKTVYSLIVVLFLSIIISSTFLLPQLKINNSVNDGNSVEPKIPGISSWGPNDLFDPTTALSHGIHGCIEVEYIETTPSTTVISPGQSVNYSIRYRLVPYSSNLTETIIVLDPKTGGSRGSNGVIYNDHVSYKPNVFILRVNEPVNVSMTYSVDETAEYGFSAPTNSIIGIGTHSYYPVKNGDGGWLHREDLEWAYTLLDYNMSVTPAWLMINRFAGTSHPETIIPVESIDFNRVPKLREGFEVEERYAPTHPHPYEWVECSAKEAVDIVNYFEDSIEIIPNGNPMWHRDIYYQGLNYSLVMYFVEPPPIM